MSEEKQKQLSKSNLDAWQLSIMTSIEILNLIHTKICSLFRTVFQVLPLILDSRREAVVTRGELTKEKVKAVTIWSTYGPYHLARVNALRSLGLRVTAFSHCLKSKDYPFFDQAISDHYIINSVSSDRVKFLNSLSRTLNLLNAVSPTLVLTCGYERPETLASIMYSRLNSDATVFLMTDSQANDKPRFLVIEYIKSLYLKLFHGFCVAGNTHSKYLMSLGVRSDNICYGYNCVNNNEISTLARAMHGTGDRQPCILCVARMVEKKNLNRFLKAYLLYVRYLSKKNFHAWKLYVCGDGEQKEAISEFILENNLASHVTLTGNIFNFDELIKLYASAKFLVLPSYRNEQWGLVVNEAMAAGIPVLVSNKCGCAYHLVRDGMNGFLFNPEDVEDITRSIISIHLLENRLNVMGEESRKIISEFSPDKFAQNVMKLYYSIKLMT